MNLQAIAQVLEDADLGQIGVDLFYEKMPADVKRGILITSQMPIQRNGYVSGLRTGTFQAISRQTDDDDYQDPSGVLESVIGTLSGEGMVVGNMNVRLIRAKHDPHVFPKSDGNIVEASVNFDIVFTV